MMVKQQKDLTDTKSVGTAATDAATADKRQPVQTFRVEDCSACIWDRQAKVRGQSVTFYSVTFERSYKDRNGSWRYTKSFDLESLENVVTLCQQASEWLRSQ